MKMVIESAEEIFDLDLDTIGYFFEELVARDSFNPNELYNVEEKVLDELVDFYLKEAISCVVEEKDYDTARDLAETKNKLLQLKERKLDVVNMW